MKKKNNKGMLALVIIMAVFIVNMLVFLGFALIGGIFGDDRVLPNILNGVTFVLVAIFFIVFSFYINARFTLISIENDNEYNLGERSTFNNLFAFQRNVQLRFSLNKRFSRSTQYIVAFTFSSSSVAQNVNRNKEIYTLNSHIANFLEEIPLKFGLKKKNFVFAFSRGSFLIYMVKQNEQVIQNICDLLIKDIYEFGEANCPHTWVQPFFGVTVVNNDESLTHQIENALLARDRSEKNFETITYYQPTFRKSVSASEVDELYEALEKKEFVVYYQPKFDLNNKQFISSEALIRWNSKKYGLLAPTKFLAKAESIGLIHDIDIYVLRQVCEDLNDLIRRGRRTLPVSVNFSLFEFYSSNFLDKILGILEEFKVPPHLIEIEITEATSQANQFLSISIIKKLKEHGIRVLMDDFGIGYSNVGNLRKIPFDVVKIDKTFIDGIVTDTKAREIVKFLIGLCKINGMEVVAEGVDNKEQVEILRKINCDTIQGFYYSQAIDKKSFEKFLDDNPFEKGGK